MQYSKGLGISDIDNSAYAENSAEDDKSWRNDDSYGGSGMIESRVRKKFKYFSATENILWNQFIHLPLIF